MAEQDTIQAGDHLICKTCMQVINQEPAPTPEEAAIKEEEAQLLDSMKDWAIDRNGENMSAVNTCMMTLLNSYVLRHHVKAEKEATAEKSSKTWPGDPT